MDPFCHQDTQTQPNDIKYCIMSYHINETGLVTNTPRRSLAEENGIKYIIMEYVNVISSDHRK